MGTISCDQGFHQVIFKTKLFQRVSDIPWEQWGRTWEETFSENLPSRGKERHLFQGRHIDVATRHYHLAESFSKSTVCTLSKVWIEKIILKYLICSNSMVYCVSLELLESPAVSFISEPAVSPPPCTLLGFSPGFSECKSGTITETQRYQLNDAIHQHQ